MNFDLPRPSIKMHAQSYITVLAVFSSLVTGTLASERLRGRALVDTCADINAPLPAGASTGAIGVVRSCLCISAIPSFLTTNLMARSAVRIVGAPSVTTALVTLINNSAGSKPCTYPENAAPACRSTNVCYFSCTNGFVASPAGNFPTACICPAGFAIRNGRCVPAPCPSGICRRDQTLHRRQHRPSKCDRGLTTCGVFGRGARTWECIDTMKDLESCGGCAVAYEDGAANGVDCSAIPGVADVACVGGRCVVSRCMHGHSLSGDQSTCVRSASFGV
ncbi:hypothetical protein HGRIS_010836 [Hohenbuehelia grisea]|uniref:Protein CPL1-like domain-containing protein n=1 Tax=Hohenbuehelia grisea TaxID=104357 RepID=A0ABR3IYF5_9AGAR